MTTTKRTFRPRTVRAMPAIACALALAATGMPATVAAQDVNTRIDHIESQLRALQRKVFPNGAGKTFAPQITGGTAAPQTTTAPSPSAVTDLLARMDTVEAQLARLTSQVELNQNRIGKLEAKFAAMDAAPAAAADGTGQDDAVRNGATIDANTAAMTGGASQPSSQPASTALPAPKPSADRVAAVKAIVMPDSGDKGEDEYLYGYRLWDAKFYPEAEQQLQKVVQEYPGHKRISYARNLLGRAYLDDGKPGTAAQWFVKNYQADKNGARAPDSLIYLSEAMQQLHETKRACLALEELQRNYATVIAGRLKTQYARASSAVNCN
ncbi:hypothetical protein RXV95_01495 [Novosphingobium sp. ZN18A2]|uniref:tetratricopeptide repeat protein n=1 Tax=Novosphingobium sp. ZN18A2 TaxID=3079861 RepID=UPI0030CAD4E9